jgi:hypothetical protein
MDRGKQIFLLGLLVVLVGFLGIVALVGFYGTLRVAGTVMILAPILGAVGLTLVTVSHLIPIAVGYELVPAHIAADPVGQATLAATADTFAAIALVTTAAGNFLGWGVVIPLYAVPFSPCSISGSCRWPPSVLRCPLASRLQLLQELPELDAGLGAQGFEQAA